MRCTKALTFKWSQENPFTKGSVGAEVQRTSRTQQARQSSMKSSNGVGLKEGTEKWTI